MNGIILLLATASVGIEYGWHPAEGGGVEYIIQLEPEALEALKDGKAIVSELPPQVASARRIRIQVGTGPVPRIGAPPADPAARQTAPATSPPADAARGGGFAGDAPPAQIYPARPGETAPPAGPAATGPAASRTPGPYGGAYSPGLSPLPDYERREGYATPVPGGSPAADPYGNRFPDGSRVPGGEATTPLIDPDAASRTSPYAPYGGAPGAFDPSAPRLYGAGGEYSYPREPARTNEYQSNEYQPNGYQPPAGGMRETGPAAPPAALPREPAWGPGSLVAPAVGFSPDSSDVEREKAAAEPQSTAAQKPSLTPEEAALAADRPWGPLVTTLLMLFASLGGNLYLAWIAREFYQRYRELSDELRRAGAPV